MLRSSGFVVMGGLLLASCASSGLSTNFNSGENGYGSAVTPFPPITIHLPNVTFGQDERAPGAPPAGASAPAASVPPPPIAQPPVPAPTPPAAKTPNSNSNPPKKEDARLLCTQYLIAMKTCDLAVQPYKHDFEKLRSAFKSCLAERGFTDEPKVCRRNYVSPDEAAENISQEQDALSADFVRRNATGTVIAHRQVSFPSH